MFLVPIDQEQALLVGVGSLVLLVAVVISVLGMATPQASPTGRRVRPASRRGRTFLGGPVPVGVALYPGDQVLSLNRDHSLLVQADGDVVLESRGRGTVWSAQTRRRGVDHAIFQRDGNFVVYLPGDRVAFETATSGHAANRMVVENDGGAVIYADKLAVWSTKNPHSSLVTPP